MSYINKQSAQDIVKKLKGILKGNTKAHDMYEIYQNDVVIASVGIRRGSNKDLGHGHIPAQIFVNSHDAKLIAICPITRDEWIEKLKMKGYIITPAIKFE